MISKYAFLVDEFPPIIREADLCRICHISKRKAAWLLEHGYIPCEDTKKKTRRFTILLTHAIQYLERLESEPEALRTPAGIFSSKYRTQARTITIIYDTQKLRIIIAQSLMDSNDFLNVTQASRLVGYSESTVSKWVVSGRLRSFRGIHGRIIAMEDLIEYMASDYATKIVVKSAIHQGWFDKYNQMN